MLAKAKSHQGTVYMWPRQDLVACLGHPDLICIVKGERKRKEKRRRRGKKKKKERKEKKA